VRIDNFFAELKRRNVYKVAVAYAVVAWLLMQIASQIFPFFGIPNWAVRLVVLLLIIGFPVALIIAWAFELTPEGIKRTESADAAHEPSGGRTWIAIVVIATLLSLGLFFLGRYTARTAGQSEAAPTMPPKSVAVLPFENLSEDKANAYFADGIQDEILARLSKIADLKIISRTSTQKYKSAPDNLREIAKQLGVTHVLEGSVQRAPDQVRITAQLINALNDSHLWAETYDRKLVDVFQVESDVAEKIASALEAKLTGVEKHEIAMVATRNPQAYDAYLQALAIYHEDNYDARRRTLKALEEAVRLDPDFAAAWALLARMETFTYSKDDKTAGRAVAARTALETTLRLNPNLAEAQMAKGFYEDRVSADYDLARRTFEELQPRWPNNADIVEALGGIALVQGDRKNGRTYLGAAIALNPRDLVLRREAAYVRMGDREFFEALRVIDQALEIAPDDPNLFAVKAEVYQALGELDKADTLLGQLHPRARDPDANLTIWYQAVLRRGRGPAIGLFRDLSAPSNSLPARLQSYIVCGLAELERLSGEAEAARADYTQARALIEAKLKEQPDNPWLISVLAQACAGLGERDVALREADHAVNLAKSSRDTSALPFHEEIRARIQARLGDIEDAITNLQHLLSIPYRGPFGPPLTPALLRLDPYFDEIRSDARFQELCKDKRS
jgi:TolB-like protein/tetratricopeptide (TPR) repeat protein